jgi:polyferredoxin
MQGSMSVVEGGDELAASDARSEERPEQPEHAIRALRSRPPLRLGRKVVQATFAAFLLYAGWRFHLFVEHFLTAGATPYVGRPGAVDAFLPISAMVGFKAWISTGVFDPVHPAALVLLLAIVGTAVLFKKGFCAWICPIGSLSEALARFGRWGFGRNLRMPALLDWPLRGIKYLLLLFFVQAVVIGMSGRDALLFLASPYNKIADVKMLQFFTSLDSGAITFLLGTAVLSVLFANFWCRYLCPYGALLGLASVVSPLKVTRNADRCTDCRRCTRACLNGIDVARADRVSSPECSGCLDCVEACPHSGTLGVALPITRRFLSPWLLPGLLLAAFFGAILVAQVSGHWESGVSYQEYMQLVPRAREFGH